MTEQAVLSAEVRRAWISRLEVADKVKGSLLTALANADIHEATQMLLSGNAAKKDVRSGDIKLPTGLTALHLAALFGDVAIVKMLLDRNANPSVTIYAQIASHSVATKFWMDARPLLFAIGAKNREAIDMLLERGAAVEMKDAWPLFSGEWWRLTGRFGWIEAKSILTALLQHGLDINQRVARQRWAMLHYCVNLEPRDWPAAESFLQHRYETVEFLLQNGADALVKDTFGRTAYTLIEERSSRAGTGSAGVTQQAFDALRVDADKRLQELLRTAMTSRRDDIRAMTGIRGSLQRFAMSSRTLDRLPLLRSRASSLRRPSISSFGGQSHLTDVTLQG